MKSNILTRAAIVLFVLCCFSWHNSLYATHIPGANITYTCNPSNPLQYTFTLTVFRTCPGTHPTTMASSYFILTNDCGLTNPVVPTFNQVGSAVDVNQLCSSVTSNCSGGTQPGVWRYVYEATITFPANCDSWNLTFDLCCRDQSSNMSGGTGNDMVCTTSLNTLTAPCNNSPIVTAQPIPYACINTNFNYCLTTYDPEGDSMTFQMMAPLGNGLVPIAHLAGFTPTQPLNNFTLDPQTGCMSMNHPTTGNYVVAVLIQEWDDNGNLISEIVHDFQIIVVNCTNTPPTNPIGGISNFSGTGTQTGANTISACFGDYVCFDVVFRDDVDLTNNLTITTDGTSILPGATFTQTGTNPATGTFCWTSQPGYTNDVITFIAYDDGCPVMGTTGFAVDFDITTGVYAGPDITICGAQTAQLQGYGSGTYTWSPATGLSCTNCQNPIASPATTTTYTVTGNLTGVCNNSDQVTVYVVPTFPLTLTPTSATICANELVQLNASGPAARGPFNYVWTPVVTLSNPAISNPIASPYNSTTYNVSVTSADGCRMTGSIPITVSGIGPTVSVSPSDTSICAGQPVQLTTTAMIIPVVCGVSSGCTGTTSTATLGTATTTTTTYSPFMASSTAGTDYTKKIQYIFTAAELNAMGYYGGTIRDLALFITTADNSRYDNVTIWMGCTSQAEFLNTSFIGSASLTQVFGPVNNLDLTNNGWHTFNITDWDWDGTSNLVVQFCTQETGNVTAQSAQYSSTSPAYLCMYTNLTTTASCAEATGTRTTARANMRFTMCQQALAAPVYQWTPTTALSNPNIANPIASPTTTTSYILNVTSNGCTGSAVATINTSPNYNIAMAASQTAICYGGTTNLSATVSVPGSYIYNWEPSLLVSDPTIANPVASPTTTTKFYVTITNGHCIKRDSITINVAGGPVAVAISPEDTVCPGTVVNLDVLAIPVACGLNPGGCSGTNETGTIGTGTTSTSTYSPFYGSYTDTRYQFLYTAADLTAMGFTAGTITQIGFDVASKLTTGALNGFTIKIGCTNLTSLVVAAGWVPTAGVVYGPTNYTSTVGMNLFTLTTPFDWDGVSNIVIETCFDNAATVSYDNLYYHTTTGFNTTMRNYSSTTTAGCVLAPLYVYAARPHLYLNICHGSLPAGATYSWSPATGLSNTTIKNPTSTVNGMYNYTVQVTDPGNPGCPYTGYGSVAVDLTNTVDATGDTTLCSVGSSNIQLNATYNGPLPPITKPCGLGQTCSGTPVMGQVGTPYSSTTTYSPFYGSTVTTTNYTKKLQSIYTAAELTAAGLNTGVIQSIALEITTSATYTYDNVRIYIGCTSQSEYATGDFIPTASLTQVYGSSNVTPVLGWNTFNITDFAWDGISNIVVQFCAAESAVGDEGALSARYSLTSPAYRCVYYTSTTTDACLQTLGSRATGRMNMQFNVCTDWVQNATYTWSPAASLNNANIANPMATVGSTTQYIVTATGGNCVVYDTVDVVITAAPTAPTVTAMPGTYCPNTSMTLTAGGGTAGTSTIEWYTGANGTGTWLGTGGSYTFTPTTSGQTYYVRREGPCGATADDQVTINLKDYIYALDGTSTNTYCTDDLGWHHFFKDNEILLSIQGDLSGVPAGFPEITIWDNGTYYQETQGPSLPSQCVSGLSPGEERFEMERSWNVDLGGGAPIGSYNLRFYYEPSERTAIENAAINHISTYTACSYGYKYPYPLGFYWFKNTGSDYTAPDYDGLHLGASGGVTPNGVNYGEMTSITNFSGGSGAIILVPDPLLNNKWLYFTGETDNKTNYLRWATETEQNTERFNIQRSQDGVNFTTIGAVAAHGNSSSVNHYTFDDVNPFSGENYYRLELVETDGDVDYSNSVRLLITDNGLGYNFYPNPTNDVVYYQYETDKKEELRIEVLDVLGKRIVNQTITSEVGINNIPVDLKTFAAGSYIVKVHHISSSNIHTAKVIKE